MHTHIITEAVYPQPIPMIDRAFDQFELNYDLEAHLHTARTDHFHCSAIDLEE